MSGQVPELILPIGHSGMVRDANYSPDGRRISTTSDDRTVKIWNADNGKLSLTLDGFNTFEIVSTVTFSPDGKSIMTINEVGNISIWDSRSGRLIFKPDSSAWKRNTNAATDISKVKYSPDGKYLFIIQDTVLNIWDARKGKLTRTIHGQRGGITSFNFSPDGRTIICSSGYGSADILDVKSGDPVRALNRKSGVSAFSAAAFTPDGRKVMIYSDEESEIWDPANGKLLTTIKSVTDSKPSFSPDGRKVLAVGNLLFRNGRWKKATEDFFSFSVDSGGVLGPGAGLYDAENGELLKAFVDPATIDTENETIGNNVPIYIVGFSPDGKTVVTVSDKCRIWDAEKGNMLYTIEGQFDDYTSLYFTPDGKRILIVSYSSTGLYDAATGNLLHSYDAPHFRIYSTPDDKRYFIPVAKLSPDGRSFYIVSGSYNSLKTWNTQNGELKLDLTGNSSPVSEAVFHSDGKSILSKSYANGSTARIWDLLNGKIIKSFEGQEWRNAVYCNKGKNINTLDLNESGRRYINTWDAVSGEKLGSVELKSDSIIKYRVSPDARSVLVIDSNYNAKILDTGTGYVLHNLTGPIADVKYSPDSKVIATTSWFDYIDIWDVESGVLRYRLRSPENQGYGDTLKFEMQMIDTLGNLSPVTTVITPEMSFGKMSEFEKRIATSSLKEVDFNSNGNILIEAGNRDNVTRTWEIQNGTFSNSFEGNKAALSPDGTKILTFDDLGNSETGPVVRDLKSNKKLCCLEPDRLQIGSARFSPDGKT
ncbi:MAG: hypothetical protein ABSA76_07025, partial [Bacteroidales bacterium]